MNKSKLNNAEFEALLLYIFVSVSMGIRGVVILRTPSQSVEASGFYSVMDDLLPYNMWGYLLLLAASIILIAPISQTTRRYYFLVAGNLLGALLSVSMASLGFVASHQEFTPLQIGSVAFFNILLVLHGGKCLWNERKEIQSLQESSSTKPSEK